jgi:hypothetical protein
MTLTHDEFNYEVDAFVGDVMSAAECLHLSAGAIAITMAAEDRLRAVVKATMPLLGPEDQCDLAVLTADYQLCVDSMATHVAVEQSSFELMATIDRTPIVRWDYDRQANRKPRSHLQITAQRGALSHILSRTCHKTPHRIESLHIPMGGERFRPCLEDVIEFLIRDCGFKGGPDWKRKIRDGRARWRRIQTRAVVRDSPDSAVAELQALGYQITPPADGERGERTDRLEAP